MIVQIIKDIAEALPVTESPNTFPTFAHGEKEYQNYEADEAEGVLVFLDEPIISNDVLTKGGYIEESYPLSILFANKTELEYTPEQHHDIIVEMRQLANRFINRLYSNQNIRSVSAISKTDVKNLFDTNVSGVILRVTVIPFNEYTACL